MIRYFRLGYPGQYLAIGLISMIIWGLSAVDPPGMPLIREPVPLYTLLFSWLHEFPYLCLLLGFLLVLTEAIWLNAILNRHSLVPSNSSIAALLFILVISLSPDSHTLTPVNISAAFLIFILQSVFRAYNEPEPVEAVYSAGFFAALGSLFYTPVTLFYLFILICFVIYRSVSWREWISSLLGFLTPFVYLLVIYFLSDRMELISITHFDPLTHPAWPVMHLSPAAWVASGLFLILLVSGLMFIISRLSDKTVELRKKTIVLLWLFILVTGTVMFAGRMNGMHFGLLAVPAAFFGANLLLQPRKRHWAEILLWLFLLSVPLTLVFTLLDI